MWARAQPALVHKSEVGHVEKVLDDAWCAGGHLVGAAIELAQARVAFGHKSRQVTPVTRQAHPHQAVRFAHTHRVQTLAGGGHKVGQGRHMAARPIGLKTPAVVGALQLTVTHAAEGQARPPVWATVVGGRQPALPVAPQHQRLPQQVHGMWRRFNIGALRHRQPMGVFVHRVLEQKGPPGGGPCELKGSRRSERVPG